MSSVSLTTVMTTRPLHPRFGPKCAASTFARLTPRRSIRFRREIERHGLVVFRDRLLNDDELVAFGKKVGDGRMEESARNVSLAADRRLVVYLTNLKDEAGHGLGFGGADTDYWHSDQEFRRAPATLASLYCLIPSPKGGATSFATTAVEHLDLPAGLLEQLRALRLTRRPAPTHDNAEHIEVSHPVIMTSPILGKDVLYVSENLIRFVGVAADESARLNGRCWRAFSTLRTSTHMPGAWAT